MATIRITRELLEHALDLPEGVTIRGALNTYGVLGLDSVDGVPILKFKVDGPDEPWSGKNELALQYEENHEGFSLVSAIPVSWPCPRCTYLAEDERDREKHMVRNHPAVE